MKEVLHLPRVVDDLSSPGDGDVAIRLRLRVGEPDPTVLPDFLGLRRAHPGEEPEIAIESGPMGVIGRLLNAPSSPRVVSIAILIRPIIPASVLTAWSRAISPGSFGAIRPAF